MILKQNSKLKPQDCRVKRGANCGSDHYLLMAKILYPYFKNGIQIQIKQNETNRKLESKKLKLYLLHQTSIKWLYQQRLEKELSRVKPDKDIEKEYGNIKQTIHKVAKEVLGEETDNKNKNRKKLFWLTEETEQLIKEKNAQYHRWLNNKTREERELYKTKNREVRNKIKQEKNEYWEQKCGQIDSLIGRSRSTEVWRTVRNMKTNETNNISPIIPLEEWRNYYKELLVEKRNEYRNDETTHNITQTEYQVTEEELTQVLRNMKTGRAPGPGDIPVDLIKAGGRALIKRICDLINTCCQKVQVPSEWKVAYITSLFKKGNRNDPGCYRGISVTGTLSRLLGKWIQIKLRQEIGHKISEDQNGFTPGRSCVDNLFVLQQVLEKMTAKGEEVHLAFIDLEKAYDSVPRSKLWEALRIIGVSAELTALIKELYKNNVAYVKNGKELSEPIETTKGLRQGCSLSPLLFNVYIEVVLERWKRTIGRMGIPINDDYLTSLHFADDQVVIAQDAYDLEYMIKRLYQEYSNWGLSVSLRKTEYLVTNSDSLFQVLINDDVAIKQVDSFKYLGATIDRNGLGTKEIEARIVQSKKIIGCLNSLWWDKNISKKKTKRG